MPIARAIRQQEARRGDTRGAPAAKSLLHAVLVGLDHLLDHLAADGAGLAAGEVAVIALLQVDADFTWCVFTSIHRELLT